MVLRRHFILFLADCVLSVLAVVLLAVCGVCHRRKTMERTWQTSLASTLCGFTLPITLWIFLDWCISALGMMV